MDGLRPICKARPPGSGVLCDLPPGHTGEHVAIVPAWGPHPVTERRWTSAGPLTKCSCCGSLVESAGLARGYRELCESCASSFAQWGCD